MSCGTTESGIFGKPAGNPPPDDAERKLSLAYADTKEAVHLGVVGDTYTLLLTGKDTAGQFSLIDMPFRREAVHRRTATTSKKLSSCSRAN